MLNIGKWRGYNYENKNAVNITTNTLPKRDVYKSPNNYNNFVKPASYKSINTSSLNIFKNDLNKTEQ